MTKKRGNGKNTQMNLLLIRPYYGITVHGDMHGDLGIVDHHPHLYPDLSFISSATIASRTPHVNVHAVDCNLNRSLPAAVLKILRPAYDVIVIKAAAPTVECDIQFAQGLKSRYPSARVVLAGQVAGILAPWIRKNADYIDDIALVPMENFISGLLHHQRIQRMDDLPGPDFSLFPYKKFRDMNGILRGSLYTSRGCSVGCMYCPYSYFFGKKVEFRSLDNVKKDIASLISLGIGRIQFRDQYFTINLKRTEALCRMIIDAGLKFSWGCETRLESLNPDLIDLMAQAGMDSLCFGVENASKKILEAYRRPVHNERKLRLLIDHLHRKNVFTMAFYMIGFPEDSWTSVRQTYEFAERLGSQAAKFSLFSPCTPVVNSLGKMKPSNFLPFTNEMVPNPSKQLTRLALEFLSDHMNNLYHTGIARRAFAKNSFLEGIYQYHVIHQRRYRETVARLKETLAAKDIFQLGEKRTRRSGRNADQRI